MDGAKTRTSGGKTLSSCRTAPLKPKPGLSGPPVLVLKEKGEIDWAEKLLPLHMFLEFGAWERVLINLMSLGLSRTSAILLKRTVSLSSDMTLQECRRYLDAVNLERIAIPAICRAEISRLRGRSS